MMASSTISLRTSFPTTTTPILRNSPSAPQLRTLRATSRCSLWEPLSPPYNFPLPPGLKPGLNAQGGLISGQASVNVVDPHMPTSYMQNFFLGVQREVGGGWIGEIDYIGSMGRHLYALYNVNRFDGDLIQHAGRFTGLTPGFRAISYGQANEKQQLPASPVS